MIFLSCTTLWSSSSLASFGVWLNFLCTYQWWNPQLLTNFIFLINFIHSFRTCSNLVWSPPHAGFSRPSVQSVSQFTRSIMSDSLWPHESQYARPPCSSPTPRVHSNTRPSSRWRHPAISSSVIPFSSCPQSLSVSESFQMSQLFAWGGQSTGVSASASFLPKEFYIYIPNVTLSTCSVGYLKRSVEISNFIYGFICLFPFISVRFASCILKLFW